MPRRTSAWSSTIRILMSSTCSPDGEHGDNGGAASRSRFDVERPGKRFRSGAHDPYPEVRVFILHGRDPTTAVLDLDADLRVGQGHANVSGRRSRVFRGVCQRLADDRVDGLEQLFARRLDVSDDLDAHGEVPAGAEIAYERCQGRLRGRRILLRHLEEQL